MAGHVDSLFAPAPLTPGKLVHRSLPRGKRKVMSVAASMPFASQLSGCCYSDPNLHLGQ